MKFKHMSSEMEAQKDSVVDRLRARDSLNRGCLCSRSIRARVVMFPCSYGSGRVARMASCIFYSVDSGQERRKRDATSIECDSPKFPDLFRVSRGNAAILQAYKRL